MKRWWWKRTAQSWCKPPRGAQPFLEDSSSTAARTTLLRGILSPSSAPFFISLFYSLFAPAYGYFMPFWQQSWRNTSWASVFTHPNVLEQQEVPARLVTLRVVASPCQASHARGRRIPLHPQLSAWALAQDDRLG